MNNAIKHNMFIKSIKECREYRIGCTEVYNG